MRRAVNAYRDWRALKEDERIGIGFEALMCVLMLVAAGIMASEISADAETVSGSGPQALSSAVVTICIAGLGLAFFYDSWSKLRQGWLRIYLARDGRPMSGAYPHDEYAGTDDELRELGERLGRLCRSNSVTRPGFAALLRRYEKVLGCYEPGASHSKAEIRELDAQVRNRLDRASRGRGIGRADGKGGSERE